MVFNCVVSFRSIPKILKNTLLQTEILDQIRIPHFTTIIRWVCRIGYYLLKRPNGMVCSLKKPWICIADHTIQVGTNKAFVVLGIPVKTILLGRALTLKDATVLSIMVEKSWTGDDVKRALRKVFNKNGFPTQIVIDGASNLNKGVRDVANEMCHKYHITYDITHLIAKLLKKKYEGNEKFKSLMKELAITSKRITQTNIGYLLPPKTREKSRFLNLPNLATWFDKILDILKRKSLVSAEKKQIKKHFGWIWKTKWKLYIRKFTNEVKAIKDVQKILKNTGINKFSYKKACSRLSVIDDSDFSESIISALTTELKYAKKVGFPLLLTSDIIESLFGKHKAIVKPHRLSEINKSILSIPVICEKITPDLIDKTFSKVTGKECNKWIKRNIPATLLSRKKVVMGE